MSVPLLEFHQVGFRYPNTTTPVLQDCSFTLEAGQKVALLGLNGSGKSTLFYLAAASIGAIAVKFTGKGNGSSINQSDCGSGGNALAWPFKTPNSNWWQAPWRRTSPMGCVT